MQLNNFQPHIREYVDYRKFLKDFFKTKKENSSDYSYRVFSRMAGISSPSHLKMVMDGKRNLTADTREKYKKAIGFKEKQDALFFDLLVQYNQEINHEKKVDLFNKILIEKEKKGLSLLAKEQFNFLSQWHYVAIYVLVDCKDFQNDPQWIVSRLRNRLSKSNVERAINDLIKLDLLEVDLEKGLRQTSGALDTPAEIQSMAIIPYHKNMIDLAFQYLEDGDWQLREFNGVTVPMNSKALKLLKEKIQDFTTEIVESTENLGDVTDVYQFNTQLFPLTEKNS